MDKGNFEQSRHQVEETYIALTITKIKTNVEEELLENPEVRADSLSAFQRPINSETQMCPSFRKGLRLVRFFRVAFF